MEDTTSTHLSPGGTAVTLLLIIGVAVTGGAGIVLLTWAQQVPAGIACLLVTVGLIGVADRRLRRHGAARTASRRLR